MAAKQEVVEARRERKATQRTFLIGLAVELRFPLLGRRARKVVQVTNRK